MIEIIELKVATNIYFTTILIMLLYNNTIMCTESL